MHPQPATNRSEFVDVNADWLPDLARRTTFDFSLERL